MEIYNKYSASSNTNENVVDYVQHSLSNRPYGNNKSK